MSLASRSSRMIAAGLIALAAFSSQSFAVSNNPLPTGKEVLERYVEKTGGREKYEAIKTMHMKSTMEFVGMNISANMDVRVQDPNLVAAVIDIPGMGVINRATDGTHAWENSPMTGPRLIEGEELKQMLEESNIKSTLTPEKFFKSIENKGIEEVEGKPAYKIEMVNNSDVKQTRYYDVESGFLVKSESLQQSQMGEIPAEIYYSDYRQAGSGLIVAHSTTMSAGPQTVKFTITEVNSNVEHPEGTFVPSDEIKELIKAAEPTTQPGQ